MTSSLISKKASHVDKVNNFYKSETIYFATKHGKEEIVAPLFHELGIDCQSIDIDTDQFGTFSGEVARTGSVRETLRKKITAAAQAAPHARLILASEGSFLPDPFISFLQSDLECLLLWDKKLDIEIYAEHLSRTSVCSEITLSPEDDLRPFLERIDVANHAVIVRPEGAFTPIFKGLHSEEAIVQAIAKCCATTKAKKVTIATDLRAHHNKTRRSVIQSAAALLIEKLCSYCPSCHLPGFAIERGIPGLPCERCGRPSAIANRVLLTCVRCPYTEERPRPDERTSLRPEECEYCNP